MGRHLWQSQTGRVWVLMSHDVEPGSASKTESANSKSPLNRRMRGALHDSCTLRMHQTGVLDHSRVVGQAQDPRLSPLQLCHEEAHRQLGLTILLPIMVVLQIRSIQTQNSLGYGQLNWCGMLGPCWAGPWRLPPMPGPLSTWDHPAPKNAPNSPQIPGHVFLAIWMHFASCVQPPPIRTTHYCCHYFLPFNLHRFLVPLLAPN